MGLEIAKLLIVQGARLSLADIQEAALESAAAELRKLGGPDAVVMTRSVNVAVRAQVDAWIQDTVTTLGGLHRAVNFAGVIDDHMGALNLDGQDDKGYEFIMDVNLRGVWNSMRAQLQHMEPGGAIVNASSAAGLIGFAGGAAYTASKHGVSGLTRSTAKEYGSKNIRINAVAP
jgi:NAD(P)-dependent dehydrogenase (short-subunit alcohol dehydrogenase family)